MAVYDVYKPMVDSEGVYFMNIHTDTGIVLSKKPSVFAELKKEYAMNNIYITIDGKTYRAHTATLDLPSTDINPTIEASALMSPLAEVSNPFVPAIKDVIFNPPATIVFWNDNTKTVVRAQGDDIYDPEKGIAIAYSKKMLGNKYDYYHTFAHYLKKWEKQQNGERI